jgi:hypothetical protein
MAQLHLHLHRHPATQLASLKSRSCANIRRSDLLSGARKYALIDRLWALPEGDRLCHGDCHMMNLIGSPGSEVAVDWLDACCGGARRGCVSLLLTDEVVKLTDEVDKSRPGVVLSKNLFRGCERERKSNTGLAAIHTSGSPRRGAAGR